MKCQVNANTTHDVLISKEITYKSYKEICSGEKKKVNLGYWGNFPLFIVENNSLLHFPLRENLPDQSFHGKYSAMPLHWEIFSKFFSLHNIEPNWLYCNDTYGHYDEEKGEWTGCVGKV